MRIFFAILRKLNNDIPTRWEVRTCLMTINGRTDLGLSDRIMDMMWIYVNGRELEHIRDFHGVSYERVRQCLMRGCKIAYDSR